MRGKEAVAAFFDTNIGPNHLTITCEETFPSSSPDRDRPHPGAAHQVRRTASSSAVRGVFTYKVNDAGLITNLRGYWNMDAMQFGQEGESD